MDEIWGIDRRPLAPPPHPCWRCSRRIAGWKVCTEFPQEIPELVFLGLKVCEKHEAIHGRWPDLMTETSKPRQLSEAERIKYLKLLGWSDEDE